LVEYARDSVPVFEVGESREREREQLDLDGYAESEVGRLVCAEEVVETGSLLRGARTYAMMGELEHSNTPALGPEDRWSDEKNARRCELIDKEIDGSISDTEREELGQLQAQVDEYVRRVAPRPLNELEEIKRLLLRERSSGERTT
jgi:hypothetical protein